ncbi:PucR family transcriptional regulator [Blastococcus sp. SYSU D00669]
MRSAPLRAPALRAVPAVPADVVRPHTAAPAGSGLDGTGMTVARTLRVPVLRTADPVVVAGAAGLDRVVRWVHTTELVDVAPLLRGGDLVLSTGIALPDGPAELAAFAESLDRSDAAGLVIELGRRWDALPAALVEACDRLALPLVALPREVRFAAVAQAVGEQIVDEQLEELRQAQRVHEVFTDLGMAEAGPAEVLEAVQQLAGATVVLEDGQHRLVDYRCGFGDPAGFLYDWQRRSRAVHLDRRTAWDAANGWLVTRVGRPERSWGRLVIQSAEPPPPRLVATAERAAAALALHNLHDRQRDSLVRRTHAEILAALLRDPTAPEVQQRCELAGLPLGRRTFVALTVRATEHTADPAPRRVAGVDAVVAAVVHAAHEERLPALIASADGDVRVLLSLDRAADAGAVTEELARRVHRRHAVVVGAGAPVDRIGAVERTLRESLHVVDSVRAGSTGPVVHRLADVHVRGLLTMLAEDDRLRMFVSRELEPLREHDARWQTGLLDAVRALVLHPCSKSDAAASLHMSRPAFYDRLTKIERLLGVDLDDPDVRLSLHAAVVADEVLTAARGDVS